MMILSAAIAYAADYDFEADGIYYQVKSLDNLTVKVVKGDNSYSGEIEIPASVSYKGKSFEVTEIGYSAFQSSKVTKVTVPQTISIINSYAFSGASSLSEFVFPTEKELTIGSFAFSESNINRLEIPDNVVSIDKYAFQSCTSLEYAKIGAGLKKLEAYLFRRCKNLETVEVPDNLQVIEQSAFSECKILKNINFPQSLTDIGRYAFSGCEEFTEIELPDNVRTVGSYAFWDCIRLKRVKMPNKVRTIESYLFTRCSQLNSVTFGANVESIKSSCFDGCTALAEITILNPEPPTCDAFENKQYMDITLKVPAEAIPAYKEAQPWKNFWEIIAADSGVVSIGCDSRIVVENGNIIIPDDVASCGVAVFDISGKMVFSGCETVVSGLGRGAYIIRTAKSAAKVIL